MGNNRKIPYLKSKSKCVKNLNIDKNKTFNSQTQLFN